MDRTRAVLLGLAGGLFVLAVLLVLPFLEFFLLAVLFAYPLRPLQRRFEDRVGPKRTAAGLVLAAVLAVVLPTLYLLRVVFREVSSFLDRIRDGDITFAQLETEIESLTGQEVDIRQGVQTAVEESGISTVDGALGIFQRITSLLIGLALTMFLLYYFLKDADRFNRWLRATAPLPDHVHDELRSELDDVMWAVLASHVFIALVQGIVAGLGLIVFGVPNAVFWTALMVVLAVLPIIGSFLVWGPASLYLFSTGQPLAGGILFVYGLIVVSLCDDFLRPIIIDRYTETRINPGAIVLGILGGVYLLGFIGIFFGPVIIGLLRSVLDVYRREYFAGSEYSPEAASNAEPAASGTETADRPPEGAATTERQAGATGPTDEYTGEEQQSTGGHPPDPHPGESPSEQ